MASFSDLERDLAASVEQRAYLECVTICESYARSHPASAMVASQIAMRIARAALRGARKDRA